MGTTQKDSTVKEMLKNLCCSYGWSYGVLWSFDQPNSLLLTMQDAYFTEEIRGLIEDLLLQVPILGGGSIGQAAITKKHLWISSQDPHTRQNSSGSIWDMFPDDSDFQCQFSSGIKTIAAIPLEPQGVVQFGSTQKVPETTEFINQTKRMFHSVINGGGPVLASSSSSNSQSCPPNGLFASLISSEDSHFTSGCHNPAGPTSDFSLPSLSFTSKPQAMSLVQPMDTGNNDASTWSANSTLTAFKDPIMSESKALDSWNSFSVLSSSPLPLTNANQDLFDSTPDFGVPSELDISQWFSHSPDQTNATLGTGLVPFNCDEKGKSLTISGIDVDFLGNGGDWGDILTPVTNEALLGYHPYNSEGTSLAMSNSKSTQNLENDSTALGQKKGLFSRLGIEELLEGISGTSNTASTSCIEDQVTSGAKRRKTGNSIWEMGSLQPFVYNNGFGPRKEAALKSEPGIWKGDAFSMNGSSTVLQAKKPVETPKPTKKKAKPGTRPRPKDRQQILDRMAELRQLIPNGEKMSIDCLLDRTIKHMLFLQSVTKHADRIKQADEPKNNCSNDPSTSGVTWACEMGNQTMICPLIVEDLSTPGQMLIEMLCEEHGFFLEIVDVIRGFGLTILKGVMEVRDEKIWARFIVDTEENRHVTRHEIFSALVRLLQTIWSSDNPLDQKVTEVGNSLLDDFHRSGVQIPVSLADTRYSMNL